jgi:hypothetical protein
MKLDKMKKAQEKYVDVTCCCEGIEPYHTSIPVEYRRTGTYIKDDELDEYLQSVCEQILPSNWKAWREEQKAFWQKKAKAIVTKEFFDILSENFSKCCASCQLPSNPNFARRIQELKEWGYTIATYPNKYCSQCGVNTTQLLMVPLKRGGITGYETWSPKLRDRIIRILKIYDVFEAKVGKKEGLLPDHKFPEIRWDESTKRECLESLTEEEVGRDFQLMSNQRNQQKREVCRNCYETGSRGIIYGINFFYEGSEKWDESYAKRGKEAEKGCVGCAWYDVEKWRKELFGRLHE